MQLGLFTGVHSFNERNKVTSEGVEKNNNAFIINMFWYALHCVDYIHAVTMTSFCLRLLRLPSCTESVLCNVIKPVHCCVKTAPVEINSAQKTLVIGNRDFPQNSAFHRTLCLRRVSLQHDNVVFRLRPLTSLHPMYTGVHILFKGL